MFKAIIFDFDGVILNSEPIHYRIFSKLVSTLNEEITYDAYVKDYLGLADEQLFSKYMSTLPHLFSAEKINQLILLKKEAYQLYLNEQPTLPMVDHIDKFIEWVYYHQKLSNIAICTNSSRIDINSALNKLNNGQLKQYISVIVTADDVTHPKPSPMPYLLAAEKLQVCPKDCLVVEDSPVGIEAATLAGMTVAGLTTTYSETQLQQADTIVSHFDEVKKLFAPAYL